MKKNARKKSSNMPYVWIALIITVVTVSLCVTYKPTASNALPQNGIVSKYSISEMQNIWSNNFQSILDNELLQNRYHIPEIQKRHNALLEEIGKMYKTNLNFSLQIFYPIDSQNSAKGIVLAGCGFVNNRPQLEIVVPALVDRYYTFQKNGREGWLDRLRYSLVVGIMHELDHFSSGEVHKHSGKKQSFEKLVDEESQAWALTCENVIAPLIEKYNIELTSTEYMYYKEWVRSGRNAKSSAWIDFIKSWYAGMR